MHTRPAGAAGDGQCALQMRCRAPTTALPLAFRTASAILLPFLNIP